MKDCSVIESKRGWAVVRDGRVIADGFSDNASAWRWVDQCFLR
jgi:hypothetical protein